MYVRLLALWHAIESRRTRNPATDDGFTKRRHAATRTTIEVGLSHFSYIECRVILFIEFEPKRV